MSHFNATNDLEALQAMLGRADTPFSEFDQAISIPLESGQDSLSFEFDDDNNLSDVKILTSDASEGFVLHLSIQDRHFGHITEEGLGEVWPGSGHSLNLGTDGNVHINGVPGTKDEQCLFIDFEPGVVGEDGGARWLSPLPPGQEYYYSYQVLFPRGFDFASGGDLPGLGSGLSVQRPNWHQAFSWGPGGIAYAVIPGQGSTLLQNGDSENFQFQTNTWHTIKAHVKVNSTDNSDGIFEVWVDDYKYIELNNIQIIASGGSLDWLYVRAYFKSVGAPKRSSVCFQEFILSTSPIQD